jgi:hypothetical protein
MALKQAMPVMRQIFRKDQCRGFMGAGSEKYIVYTTVFDSAWQSIYAKKNLEKLEVFLD